MNARSRSTLATIGIFISASLATAAADAPPAAADTFASTVLRIREAGAAENAEVPVVAHNSRFDQYLVVWSDQREAETRSNDVYGQRLAADGSRIGENFRISGDDAIGPEYPVAVAYNSVANQYLVLWLDERPGGFDIYGRRVKANGSLAGGEFVVDGSVLAGAPEVSYNPVTNQ